MVLELEQISTERLPALKNLFELVAYDLSEFGGTDVNENGLYVTNLNLKDWHEDPNYRLYFITVSGNLAGFVIIKYLVEKDTYYLNHFFVLRKYRKQNIGKQAAIKAFDLFAGNWRVSEFDWNMPAQLFWRKVISSYTDENFTERRRADDKGPMQEFTTCTYDENSSSKKPVVY
ncbi:GNAT family N-acetyltransferase [Paenibacillus kobensis]|uniref:GNAT family N-acetyltransferase n=1 Tax=Paenibacillus kobensis TaxID=59841 RepID=UPI0013E32C4A|nr:GNAT family N-acetyltransferase [Paenibacillus kobensis]